MLLLPVRVMGVRLGLYSGIPHRRSDNAEVCLVVHVNLNDIEILGLHYALR
jgi:hypothetical protein